MTLPFSTKAIWTLAWVLSMGSVAAQEEAVVKRPTQLRASPSENAPSVVDLAANSTLNRGAKRQGVWVQASTPAGASGWVSLFDIGAPLREVVTAVLRGMSRSPNSNTVATATATIGIRGFGQGGVPVASGAASRGPSGAEVLALAERSRASAADARAFANMAGYQPRELDALPVPALPAGLQVAAANAEVPAVADALLNQALRAPDSLTEAQEVELGRQMAAGWLQGQPLDATPGVQTYVNRLGRWLSLQTTRPGLPWTFVVVDEAEFQIYSAPGGWVVVSRGLLDRCADEAELAGLLAHEIAHVVQRHGLKALRMYASTGQIGARGLADLAHAVQRHGHGAVAELEADRLAVATVARAGLDAYGLMAALVQQNALNDGDLHYAEAHPQSRIRLDQLEQAMRGGVRLPAPPATNATVEQRLAALGKP